MDKVEKALDIVGLRAEVAAELTGNILPYWIEKMVDTTNGGFFGQRNGHDTLLPLADKGCVLNARILWTFSHAAIVEGHSPEFKKYLGKAHRAFVYLRDYFIDRQNGGLYWMVDHKGQPVDTKKQIYAQAFGIYALSEYYMASADKSALKMAIELFQLIERHSWEKMYRGYLEAFDSQWNLLDDLRLSDKDANERKTMNTHLHVLEAYTNLYRCWKDGKLKAQLLQLIQIFLEKIINDDSHLNLFFDDQWYSKSKIVSYGHTIEASWLLQEAAQVLGDEALIIETKNVALRMVAAVEKEGINQHGALINEKHMDGSYDTDMHWWPQAEALVAWLNAWQVTGNQMYLEKVATLWTFIKSTFVDSEKGEWHWRLDKDLNVAYEEDKAGPWKCPYHNGRACMELMKRLDQNILK